ncbi:hypothetical protein Mapa_012468 [Marchantia paleacea]|nr:hypothetical protein Mapa_012468 [Marchantia paleacea]
MASMMLRGINRASVGWISSPLAAGGEGELNFLRRGLSARCSSGTKRFSRISWQRLSTLASNIPRPVALVSRTSTGLHPEEKVEAALTDFILDGSKTTSIAHKVWRTVVRPGDTVIDATCGNGHDTLMLAKLVLQEATAGYVIGLDLQQGAIDNTSALLDRELDPNQRDKVNLLLLCHSQLDKVVDESSVRLVCFNLGYQPGGDKSFITRAESTVNAVRAATKVIEPQGLISIMSYVGHPGGQEEYEAVRDFLASLSPNDWVCSHLSWTNRPLCPHLMFVLRK